MKTINLFNIGLVALIFASCGNHKHDDASQETSTTQETVTETIIEEEKETYRESKNGVTITMQENSLEFANASLIMNEPIGETVIPVGKTKFSFTVKNFELSKQTSDASDHHCANSEKGQHIHLIVDNMPYIAHYESDFTEELKKGQHTILAFLSRSYHESIKSKDAYVFTQIEAGEETIDQIDLKAKHMFYSRPKGTYSGPDAQKILLDFYLVNTDLSPEGNKVKATINGTTFMLPHWKPYIIEGLPMGDNTVKLELLDKAGNLIEGPFNTVERKFTLEQESAAK